MSNPVPPTVTRTASRRRRWRWFAVAALSCPLLLIALSPVWSPWAVRFVASRLGATLTSCERAGYWRVALNTVRIERDGLVVTANRVEMLQPLGYLVDRLARGWLTSSNAPGLRVMDWEVLVRTATQATPGGPGSTHTLLEQISDVLAQLQVWLPSTELTRGRIQAAGGELRLPELRWEAGRLYGIAETARLPGPIQIEAAHATDGGLSLRLAGEEGRVELGLERPATDRVWAAKGKVSALENELAFEARWTSTGWLPAQVRARATSLRWPASAVPLPDGLGELGGSFGLDWQDARGRLTLHAGAACRLSSLPEPIPVELDFEGEADQAQLRVTRLTLDSKPLRLDLESPVAVRFADLPALAPFRLRARVAPGVLAPGQVSGHWEGQIAGEVRPDLSAPLTFEFAGNELSALGAPVEEAIFAGNIEWPVVRVDQARIAWGEFRLQASAMLDLAAERFREMTWSLEGLPPVAAALAAPFQSLRASGQVSGPFAEPEHAGTIHTETTRLASLNAVSADLRWRGAGSRLEAWDLSAAAGPLKWELGGAARLAGLDPFDAELDLQRLVWTCDGLERGRLRNQARLGIRLPPRATSPPGARTASSAASSAAPPPGAATGGATADVTGPIAQLSPLVIEGEALQLRLAGDVSWPASGRLELGTTAFPLADVRHLAPAIPPELNLESLVARVGWTNGPVMADARSAVTYRLAAGESLRLVTDLHLDRRGLSAGGQLFRRTNESVAQVTAALPWRAEIRGGAVRALRDPESLLSLRVEATEDAEAWGLLTSRFGLSLENPSLRMDVTSRGNRLRGEAQFQAGSIRSENAFGGTRPPPVEQVALRLELAEDGLLRADLGFGVAGQRATGQVELPMAPFSLDGEGWDWPPDWTLARGELRLPEWSVEALAPWLPEPLLPAGTVAAQVRLDPGLALTGRFAVNGLATRPLPGVGAVREVNMQGRLDSKGLEVIGGRAELSGRPVLFSGFYHLAANDGPRFKVELAGTNLALVRTSDVFLRGDARIELNGTDRTNATVGGEVMLHDSLLLRDLQSLMAGGVQEPESRPPFFSVDVEPFSAWRLNVRVAGERFLRVVTPVFRGWVSTGLQLGGTLREPIAVGEVTVPEGRVVFPFGALAVDQARVSLTREDPFRPRLQVRASGRNFGYDLRLDATGPADAANLVFGSVPPLSSTQVLLMLTTGDIPGEAYTYSTRGKLQSIGMFVGREFLGQLAGDPGEERLTMRTGEEVTDRGQLTYRVEYRVAPRWSLFGEQDRFDTYLGGVIYTLYEK